jgi:hypothetical protein
MIQVSFIPITRVEGDIRTRLLQVDYVGSVLSTIAILLILVPSLFLAHKLTVGSSVIGWCHFAMVTSGHYWYAGSGVFLGFPFYSIRVERASSPRFASTDFQN